jgi:hypothetical protein
MSIEEDINARLKDRVKVETTGKVYVGGKETIGRGAA